MPRSPQQIAAHEARLDRLAELLALEIPVPQIAERLGCGRGGAYRMLNELCARLGPQAR